MRGSDETRLSGSLTKWSKANTQSAEFRSSCKTHDFSLPFRSSWTTRMPLLSSKHAAICGRDSKIVLSKSFWDEFFCSFFVGSSDSPWQVSPSRRSSSSKRSWNDFKQLASEASWIGCLLLYQLSKLSSMDNICTWASSNISLSISCCPCRAAWWMEVYPEPSFSEGSARLFSRTCRLATRNLAQSTLSLWCVCVCVSVPPQDMQNLYLSVVFFLTWGYLFARLCTCFDMHFGMYFENTMFKHCSWGFFFLSSHWFALTHKMPSCWDTCRVIVMKCVCVCGKLPSLAEPCAVAALFLAYPLATSYFHWWVDWVKQLWVGYKSWDNVCITNSHMRSRTS